MGWTCSPPQTDSELQFESLDLGQESSTRALYELLRDTHAYAVVHLAFVIDPVRTGCARCRAHVADQRGGNGARDGSDHRSQSHDRRRSEAVHLSQQRLGIRAESAGAGDGRIARWRRTPCPTRFTRKQSDEVVQTRSHALRGCSVYILRPHIFAGASVENYLMGAFRGTPNGKSARAEKMRTEGKRLPCMLPRGQQYLDNKIQFIHVDDMARLIRHILQREPETQRLTVLNVAGRGEPLTFGRCVEMAQAKLVRVPGKWAMRQVLRFLWKQKISAIPPEAVPYMTGRVHHEHRPAAPVSGPGVRARDPLHHCRRVCRQFQASWSKQRVGRARNIPSLKIFASSVLDTIRWLRLLRHRPRLSQTSLWRQMTDVEHHLPDLFIAKNIFRGRHSRRKDSVLDNAVQLAVGVGLHRRRIQRGTGGAIFSANGTPVFWPSSPWQTMQYEVKLRWPGVDILFAGGKRVRVGAATDRDAGASLLP